MPPDYQEFEGRLNHLRAGIKEAARAAGRAPEEISILPVTKGQPPLAVEFAARAGLEAIGENRVQEAIAKSAEVRCSIRWELIGHLQSNKVRAAVKHFARIQSMDTPKLLRLTDQAARDAGKVLPVLLQVNAGRDPAKFGAAIEEAPALLEAALALPNLRVDGLMTIAPLEGGTLAAREAFGRLRALRDALAARFVTPLRELSMGMSGDLREAILEGSTQVRVGSALFGERA